jgi:uncharacterized membrane protein
MHYVVPAVVEWSSTMIAGNIGGAVVPLLMPLYLLIKYELWTPGPDATCIVAAVCYALAQPVPSVGIAMPVFVPTAIAAVLLARQHAAPSPTLAAASAR